MTIARGVHASVQADSILGLMTLGAFQGDEITITAAGRRAGQLADDLAAMAEANHDERK